jgi:hypothetical protein
MEQLAAYNIGYDDAACVLDSDRVTIQTLDELTDLDRSAP